MDADLMEAARFLNHATFGANYDEIVSVNEIGFENWMNEQFSSPPNYLLSKVNIIWEDLKQRYIDHFEVRLAEAILDICEVYPDTSFTQAQVDAYYEQYIADDFGPYVLQFNYAWWDNMAKADDQLRQKMAYALSQILVVSSQSDLGDHAHALAGYYDILIRHSFGNFRDLLMEITLSPAMGYYLSHLNNPRANPDENVHPDENYAREIMQLFTIGLYMLNLDGPRMKDSNGNDIPTYDNNDIKELAKVFTGLGAAEIDPFMDIWWTDEAYFGLDLYSMHKTFPMKMYEEYHEPAQKTILKDLVIPPNQGGMVDIEMTVDYLFNHPNVGPFISKLLIQRLIKSNPSPEYVGRVAAVFNSNENGVRGDLQSVLYAILMDEEARSCNALLDPDNGRLREPTLRHTHLTRAIPSLGVKYVYDVNISSYDCNGVSYAEDYTVLTEDLNYWHNGYSDYQLLRQHPLMAPSVFNFYLPDHQPVGEMTQLGLVGPEFKIHDSGTSINYLNMALIATFGENNLYSYDGEIGVENIVPDFSGMEAIAALSPDNLLNYMDIVFTHGQLSDQERDNIRTMMDILVVAGDDNLTAKILLYFILISPDYAILK